MTQFNMTQNLKSISERIENNLGKGENAGYQHFLCFPECFAKAFSFRFVRSQNCVVKVQCLQQACYVGLSSHKNLFTFE